MIAGPRRTRSIKQGGAAVREAAPLMQRSSQCLHTNASEPLIYYNPIVGEACERGHGCSSISVHASPKVQQL